MESSKKRSKMVATMTKKYGSYEAWVQHMRENGSKGGKNAKNNKHFRDNPELARLAGIKSGEIRRNNKKDVAF